MNPKIIGLSFVFLWFAVGGVFHFISPEYFVRIVPPYIPYPLAMVYISGVFELLGAAGLISRRSRSAAGIGLLALTLCVTPANVHMWMHPELFPDVSETVLGVRLIVQVALLACIWWSTRPSVVSRFA